MTLSKSSLCLGRVALLASLAPACFTGCADSSHDGVGDDDQARNGDLPDPEPVQPGIPLPSHPDSDQDGIDDGREALLGTDSLERDSDGDGAADGVDPLPLDQGVHDHPFALYLRSGATVPPLGLHPQLQGAPQSVVVVQLGDGEVHSEQLLAELEADHGASLLTYLPRAAFLARVDPGALGELADDQRVRSVFPWRDHDRVNPQLWSEGVPLAAIDSEGATFVSLVMAHDRGPAEIENHLLSLGALEVEATQTPGIVSARMPVGGLGSLAIDPEVFYMELAYEERADTGLVSRTNANVDDPSNNPLMSETGAGVATAFFEIWYADRTHAELSGDVTHNSVQPLGDHATATASLVTGTGAGSGGAGTGIAPDATVHSYANNYITTGALESRYTDAVVNHGVSIINNSWGGSRPNGQYSVFSTAVDRMIHDGGAGGPLTVTWATGNARSGSVPGCFGPQPGPNCERVDGTGEWDCVSSSASSKSTLSVGSTDMFGADSCFSNHGPTDDGRIKPEVAALGENTTVADRGSGGLVSTFSGTSAAAPNVAGVAALMTEAFANEGLSAPQPATLRGLLMHSATDLPNNGTAPTGPVQDGPSFRSGFGRVDALAARTYVADHATDDLITESSFTGIGQFDEIEFVVQPYQVGGPGFRATLTWDDLEAFVGGIKTLQHDLDLRVVSPSGHVYFPWKLDPTNPANNPVCVIDSGGSFGPVELGPCTELASLGAGLTTKDDTNVVEQVFVPTATEAGVWTVRVDVTRVVARSASATPNVPFSLLLPFDQRIHCGDELPGDARMFEDLECDSSSGVSLGASNMEFDCQGHTLSGTGVGRGVDIDTKTDVTVRNCTIDDFDYGLYSTSSSANTFIDNTLRNSQVNLVMVDTDTSAVKYNWIENADGRGVYVGGGVDDEFIGNKLWNNGPSTATSGGAIAFGGEAVVEAHHFVANLISGGFGGVQVASGVDDIELLGNNICRTGGVGVDYLGTNGALFSNVVCQSTGLDVTVRWSSWNATSTDNACDTTDAWLDAGAVSGCTHTCMDCMAAASLGPSVDVDPDGWDWWPLDDSILDVLIGVDLLAPTQSVTGDLPIGPAINIDILRQGTSGRIAINHLLDAQALLGLRRSSLSLQRFDPAQQLFVPIPGSGPLVNEGGVSALVDEPGLYRVFASDCDLWLDQALAPQQSQAWAQVQPGDVVCLNPALSYDDVALHIQVPDVTLDCQGASLSGPGTCVELDGSAQSQVLGCQLEACAMGIAALASPGAQLVGNHIEGGQGLLVQTSPGAEVRFNALCEGAAFDVDPAAVVEQNSCAQGCELSCG